MNGISTNSIGYYLKAPSKQAGQLILIGGVAAIISMVVLPLPTGVLDFFLALNIVASITLLMVAVSVGHQTKIASFPTLLLLSTLFRLGLNLASTRLILSEGYAGHIIETFGQFATNGNLVVGFLMFAILTIIQFIVVSKGSERVAEVAARFSLDAMPGKQMSIDADLRAGLINQAEAKNQREELVRESKLYGSMDGAMKFVKGDTIAGILIIFVNILGGLFTGVVQHNLSITQALYTYTSLTIGDGLVSQLPALLVSITAGFVVTRVADANSEKTMGEDIGLQLLSHPKALVIASLLSLVVGVIPGFPFFFFAIISATLAGTSFLLGKNKALELKESQAVDTHMIDEEQNVAGLATPFLLEVGPELYQIFKSDDRWQNCFTTLYPQLKKQLTREMGVDFPELKIFVNAALKHSYNYQIRVFEIVVDTGLAQPRSCAKIVSENSNVIVLEKHLPQSTNGETVHGTPLALWELNQKDQLSQAGIQTYGPEEMLIRHLGQVLRKQAAEFIGVQEVKRILNEVAKIYPDLVDTANKAIGINRFTEVIQRLVEENVPVKNFRLILQILVNSDVTTKSPVEITEIVRHGMKRIFGQLYTENGKLNVVTLEDQLADEIAHGIQYTGSDCFLALKPEQIEEILGAFKKALVDNHVNSNFVVLTRSEIRRPLRKILENILPDIVVLSHEELDRNILVQAVAHVTAVTLDELNYQSA